MMRKLLSVVLCLALLFSTCAALAGAAPQENPSEVVGQYRVSFVVPEGYTFTSNIGEDGGLLVFITPSNENAPHFLIIVRHSELYNDQTINDLTAEEKAELIAALTADYAEPLISYDVTGLGTELVIADENGSASDYVDLFSLYKGYLVDMSVFHADNITVTKEDIQLGIKQLTDMTFTEIAQ